MGDKDKVQSSLTETFIGSADNGAIRVFGKFADSVYGAGSAFVYDNSRIEPSKEEREKSYGMRYTDYEALNPDIKAQVRDTFIKDQMKRYLSAHSKTLSDYGNFLLEAQTNSLIEVKDVAEKVLESEIEMLKDKGVIGDIEAFEKGEKLGGILGRIKNGDSAEVAVDDEYQSMIDCFRGIEGEDEHVIRLRKTADDLENHRASIQHYLHPYKTLANFKNLKTGSVLVCPSLPMSALSHFVDEKTGDLKVEGIICSDASLQSHAAIFAQAMGIPYILVPEKVLSDIKNGDRAILDGHSGQLILHPNNQLYDEYLSKIETQAEEYNALLSRHSKKKSSITLDGEKVNVHANFAMSIEANRLKKANPVGQGLYRTEVTVDMRDGGEPTPEIWKDIIKTNMAACAPRGGGYIGATIRTADFDGDKSKLPRDKREEKQSRVTRSQFKGFALLQDEFDQENRKNKIKVMVPMIESSEHMMRMQKIMDEQAAEAGVKSIKLGCMLERQTLIADLDTLDTDFVSIGTNDLIANLLYPTIGRYSSEAKEKYDPTNKLVLQSLENVVNKCTERGIPVSLCGNMASEPKYTALLIGVGLRNISCGVNSIPKIKEMATRIDSSAAQDLVDRMIHEPIRAKREEMLTAFNEALGLSPDGTIDLDWAPPKKPADELDFNPNGMN